MEYRRGVSEQVVDACRVPGHECCRERVTGRIDVYKFICRGKRYFKFMLVAEHVGVSCRNAAALVVAGICEVVFAPVCADRQPADNKFNRRACRNVIVGA